MRLLAAGFGRAETLPEIRLGEGGATHWTDRGEQGRHGCLGELRVSGNNGRMRKASGTMPT